VPDVRYLRTPRGSIAHQVFGSGDRTIIFTGPAILSIETRWDHPSNLRLWEFLATLGRVVLFDYRGFGISEHLPLDRVGQLEELCFDLKTVVAETASAPAVIVATGTSSMPAISIAATHPALIDRMVLLNAIATGRVLDHTGESIADIGERWGTGEVLARGAGRELDDFRRRASARHERISATPWVVAAYFTAAQDHDVRHLLASVEMPTLVVHTGDSARISPAMSEETASEIPGARYLVRPSSLFNWGEWDSDVKHFITGDAEGLSGQRDLAAVLFTDVVGSTEHAARIGDTAWRETIALLDAFVERQVSLQQGRVIKQTGDGHLVEFARPGDALAAAQRLVEGSPGVGVSVRVGVHFGEVERRPNGDIGGIAVHLAARVAAEAGANEILVSRTVTELTTGDGRMYRDRGAPTLKGIPGSWQLFELVRPPLEAPLDA
jgi:class 3 adenylate cyclase